MKPKNALTNFNKIKKEDQFPVFIMLCIFKQGYLDCIINTTL